MNDDVGAERETWLRVFAASAQEQARIDATPCPKCGGDRLRQDFTGPGRCHVARREAEKR